MKPKLSLKGRGLQWLAQREHSRSELRQKLLRHARADLAAQQAALSSASSSIEAPGELHHVDDVPVELHEPTRRRAQAAAAADPSFRLGQSPTVERTSEHPPEHPLEHPPQVPTAPEHAVDAVLDWLEAHRYLSEERFVESRVHARAARYGNLRIRQELAQHGVSLSAEEAQALRASELARARDVWRRKFGDPPVDASDRARQMRFLAGRGFSPEVIRKVVQGAVDDD